MVFTSQVTYDLEVYREFMKGIGTMIRSRIVVECIAIVYLAVYVFLIGFLGDSAVFLAAAVILLIIFGVVKLVNRGGGLQYKRMVSNNGGRPVRNRLIVSENTIRIENMDNGNSMKYGLEKIRGIGETANLYILLLDYRQGLIIDKRTLTGGTSEDFAEYMLSACPDIKKCKVQSGKGAKLRQGLILSLLLLGLALSLVQSVLGEDDPYYQISGGKLNGLSCSEIAGKLESFGIGGITEEMENRLEEDWTQYPDEYKAYADKAVILLTELGCGTYDEETWEWNPSSEDVYAFDMEFLNLESMYSEFLRGISAIGGGDLDFTDIEENLDQIDWEDGTGSRTVKFRWNGANCILGAEMMNDWFDPDFADDLNKLITARSGNQLYFGSDGGQMILVFYCDAAWAAAFEDVTGIRLSETLDRA